MMSDREKYELKLLLASFKGTPNNTLPEQHALDAILSWVDDLLIDGEYATELAGAMKAGSGI